LEFDQSPSPAFPRLLLYTCRMFEGGLCVLDKFLATTAHKKLDNNNNAEADQLDVCHKMQPVNISALA
jgi:hypothetical protein